MSALHSTAPQSLLLNPPFKAVASQREQQQQQSSQQEQMAPHSERQISQMRDQQRQL